MNKEWQGSEEDRYCELLLKATQIKLENTLQQEEPQQIVPEHPELSDTKYDFAFNYEGILALICAHQ